MTELEEIEREDNFRLKRFKEHKEKVNKAKDVVIKKDNDRCTCNEKPGKGDDFLCPLCQKEEEEKRKNSKKSICASESHSHSQNVNSPITLLADQKPLEDLADQLKEVISLSVLCQTEGLVSPSIEAFIDICKEERSKLEQNDPIQISCMNNEIEKQQRMSGSHIDMKPKESRDVSCCTEKKSKKVKPQSLPCSEVVQNSETEDSIECFETKYKETVKVKKFQNEDGKISEERETVTIKTERTYLDCPHVSEENLCCKKRSESISSSDSRSDDKTEIPGITIYKSKSEETRTFVRKEQRTIRSCNSNSGAIGRTAMRSKKTSSNTHTCCPKAITSATESTKSKVSFKPSKHSNKILENVSKTATHQCNEACCSKMSPPDISGNVIDRVQSKDTLNKPLVTETSSKTTPDQSYTCCLKRISSVTESSKSKCSCEANKHSSKNIEKVAKNDLPCQCNVDIAFNERKESTCPKIITSSTESNKSKVCFKPSKDSCKILDNTPTNDMSCKCKLDVVGSSTHLPQTFNKSEINSAYKQSVDNKLNADLKQDLSSIKETENNKLKKEVFTIPVKRMCSSNVPEKTIEAVKSKSEPCCVIKIVSKQNDEPESNEDNEHEIVFMGSLFEAFKKILCSDSEESITVESNEMKCTNAVCKTCGSNLKTKSSPSNKMPLKPSIKFSTCKSSQTDTEVSLNKVGSTMYISFKNIDRSQSCPQCNSKKDENSESWSQPKSLSDNMCCRKPQEHVPSKSVRPPGKSIISKCSLCGKDLTKTNNSPQPSKSFSHDGSLKTGKGSCCSVSSKSNSSDLKDQKSFVNFKTKNQKLCEKCLSEELNEEESEKTLNKMTQTEYPHNSTKCPMCIEPDAKQLRKPQNNSLPFASTKASAKSLSSSINLSESNPQCVGEVSKKDAATCTRLSDRYDVRTLKMLKSQSRPSKRCRSDYCFRQQQRSEEPKRCKSCCSVIRR